jgi:hypothetical protein
VHIFSGLPNLLRVSEMLSEKIYGEEAQFDFIKLMSFNKDAK